MPRPLEASSVSSLMPQDAGAVLLSSASQPLVMPAVAPEPPPGVPAAESGHAADPPAAGAQAVAGEDPKVHSPEASPAKSSLGGEVEARLERVRLQVQHNMQERQRKEQERKDQAAQKKRRAEEEAAAKKEKEKKKKAKKTQQDE